MSRLFAFTFNSLHVLLTSRLLAAYVDVAHHGLPPDQCQHVSLSWYACSTLYADLRLHSLIPRPTNNHQNSSPTLQTDHRTTLPPNHHNHHTSPARSKMEPMTLELVDETPSAPNGVPAANNTTLPASATSHAARTYTPFLPPAAVTSRVAQTPLLAAATTYQRSREQRLAQRRAKDPRRPILFHDVFGVDDDTEDPEDTVRPLTGKLSQDQAGSKICLCVFLFCGGRYVRKMLTDGKQRRISRCSALWWPRRSTRCSAWSGTRAALALSSATLRSRARVGDEGRRETMRREEAREEDDDQEPPVGEHNGRREQVSKQGDRESLLAPRTPTCRRF